MLTTLRDELHQRKPFPSVYEEAALNIVRTMTMLNDAGEDLFKPHGITATQYNVLRILRGAEPTGLYRNELRDRLLTRMPDVTRLLDRMERSGLVVRTRGNDDRRLVSTRITTAGMELVNSLDAPVAELHQRQLGHLSVQELRSLIDTLTRVRNAP